MNNEQHGPVRQLVERAIEAGRLEARAEDTHFDEMYHEAAYQIVRLWEQADIHDARYAALVEAAAAFVAVLDDERGLDPHAAEERKAQLSAALEAQLAEARHPEGSRWEPVEDNFVVDSRVNPVDPYVTGRETKRWLTVDTRNGLRCIEACEMEDGDDVAMGIVVHLPPTLDLCERVSAAELARLAQPAPDAKEGGDIVTAAPPADR